MNIYHINAHISFEYLSLQTSAWNRPKISNTPCLIRKWTEGQKFKTLVWAQAFSQKFEERLPRNIHFCAACILQLDLCNVSFHLVQYTLSGAWNATVMGICRIRLAQIKTCSKCAQLIEIQLRTEVHKCDSGRFRKGSFWDEHLIWSDRSVTVVCPRISIHVIYLSASGWYIWAGNGWQLAVWNTTKFTRLLQNSRCWREPEKVGPASISQPLPIWVLSVTGDAPFLRNTSGCGSQQKTSPSKRFKKTCQLGSTNLNPAAERQVHKLQLHILEFFGFFPLPGPVFNGFLRRQKGLGPSKLVHCLVTLQLSSPLTASPHANPKLTLINIT